MLAARRADIAIVFAIRAEGEGFDSADLSLPWGQDALIAAVASANANTVVVLETGNPVTMPWRDSVNAIMQAWYPGQAGGQAVAEIVTGQVNPSGRLPITFPVDLGQTPRSQPPELGGVGIDDRVQPVPIGFVAVQREVFRRRNDTLLLNPDDRLRGHRGTQQRVLGKVLEVAAVTRVARQIDCAGQLHVEPATARLPADRFARGPGQHRVKAAARARPAGSAVAVSPGR